MSFNCGLPPAPSKWDKVFARKCCELFKQGKLEEYKNDRFDPTEILDSSYETATIYFVHSQFTTRKSIWENCGSDNRDKNHKYWYLKIDPTVKRHKYTIEGTPYLFIHVFKEPEPTKTIKTAKPIISNGNSNTSTSSSSPDVIFQEYDPLSRTFTLLSPASNVSPSFGSQTSQTTPSPPPTHCATSFSPDFNNNDFTYNNTNSYNNNPTFSTSQATRVITCYQNTTTPSSVPSQNSSNSSPTTPTSCSSNSPSSPFTEPFSPSIFLSSTSPSPSLSSSQNSLYSSPPRTPSSINNNNNSNNNNNNNNNNHYNNNDYNNCNYYNNGAYPQNYPNSPISFTQNPTLSTPPRITQPTNNYNNIAHTPKRFREESQTLSSSPIASFFGEDDEQNFTSTSNEHVEIGDFPQETALEKVKSLEVKTAITAQGIQTISLKTEGEDELLAPKGKINNSIVIGALVGAVQELDSKHAVLERKIEVEQNDKNDMIETIEMIFSNVSLNPNACPPSHSPAPSPSPAQTRILQPSPPKLNSLQTQILTQLNLRGGEGFSAVQISRAIYNTHSKRSDINRELFDLERRFRLTIQEPGTPPKWWRTT